MVCTTKAHTVHPEFTENIFVHNFIGFCWNIKFKLNLITYKNGSSIQDVLVSVWVFFYYSAVINMKLKCRAGGRVYWHNLSSYERKLNRSSIKWIFNWLFVFKCIPFDVQMRMLHSKKKWYKNSFFFASIFLNKKIKIFIAVICNSSSIQIDETSH